LSTTPAPGTVPTKRLTAAARREVIERSATELFAERGYNSASMDEIARRSGVSVPVVYEHFPSKQDLHRRLLELHFAELRAIWRDHALDGGPPEQRLPGALDAWFLYVQEHPYAWRMLFRDTTGDPEAQRIHQEVAAQSRATLLPLLAREPGAKAIAGSDGDEALDMVWEVLRAVLQGLALWWYEHRHVPREQILATAMNALWIGFDRARQGERWQPTDASPTDGQPRPEPQ
jgi:AcrR family transcriptional regulator